MAYTYLKAQMPMIGKSQKDKYVDLFQETLNRQFTNASDVWTIQEELPYAGDVWYESEVRVITHVINNETGDKLGDDYRKIMFKDIDHATGPGYMYYFDENYWVVINADIHKNLAASCVVKRCNNVLRWTDPDGGYFEVPCSIDYLIKENRDFATAGTALVAPAAQLEVLCQWNTKSNRVRPNQRFLFGNANNWNAFRVLGGGVNNYNNMQTEDNLSAGLLRLSMMANYVNPDTDDLTNGIADIVQYTYDISVEEDPLTIQTGLTRQFHATVTVNNQVAPRTIIWASDDEDVATVSSTGLLTAVAVGTCTVRATLENNTDVYEDITVTVQSAPVVESEILINPNVNYVLEGKTTTFTVGLYENGVLQADAFVFTLDARSIPYDHYVYTTLGNAFTVENVERFLTDYLEVTGTTTGPLSRTFRVYLKGMW